MLDPNRFVQENRETWRELEREINHIEATNYKDFTVERAQNLGRLYRQSSADLIRARTETANEPLIDYLNGLVGRAYGTIYRSPPVRWGKSWEFLAFTFPHRIRKEKWSVVAAAVIIFLGFIAGLMAEYLDSSAKYYLMPPQFSQIEENIDKIKKNAQSGAVMGGNQSATMFSSITTNNVRVCILAFALGATVGIGTVLVLFYNGVIIGVAAAIFMRHSLSLQFWAYVLPHGVLELFCIFSSGAAGFMLAKAIVDPGLYGRVKALKEKGRESVDIILGCSLLLIVAGFIEGFITPQPYIPHGLKLLFAFATLLMLVAYIGFNEQILATVGQRPPAELRAER